MSPSDWIPVICPSCHQEAHQFPPEAAGACMRCFKREEGMDADKLEAREVAKTRVKELQKRYPGMVSRKVAQKLRDG